MGIINKIIGIANLDVGQLIKRSFSFSIDSDYTKDKVNEKTKEIQKKPFIQHVENRYQKLHITENTDYGEHGYSTRSDIDFTEVEQCFRDPKVSQSLDRLIDDIFADPFVVEAKDDTEESQLALKYCNQIRSEIEGELEDFLETATRAALFLGHSVSEVVPKWSEDLEFKGKRVINYVHSIRLGLIEFMTNDNDRPVYIHSLIETNDYYDLDRFFILRFSGLWDNAYGDSLFLKIRPYWKAKLIVRDDMLITSNRYSQPIPSVTYNDEELHGIAQRISDNLYAGVNMALPEGIKAEFVTAGLNGENPHMVIIEYLDKMISFGICGYDLSSEVGARAADEVKTEEKQKRINRIRRKIASAYNEQVIRRFIKHNYSLGDIPVNCYPEAKFYVADDVDIKEFVETVEISLNIGLLDFDKRVNDFIYCRKKMGFPDLSKEEIEELINQSKVLDKEDEEIEDKDIQLFNYNFE